MLLMGHRTDENSLGDILDYFFGSENSVKDH